MNVRIPVLVESRDGVHLLRPLLHPQPEVRDRVLSRGLEAIHREVRAWLRDLAATQRHVSMASFLWNPDVDEHRLELRLELRRQSLRLDLLLVAQRVFDRRVVSSPQIPDLWFSVERGQSPTERAEAIYLTYFRELERQEGTIDPDEWGLGSGSKAWLTTIELDVELAAVEPKRMSRGAFAWFGSPTQMDGAEQLEAVARCLDHCVPDELDHAFEREAEVEEVLHSATSRPPRPVVLVGPRQVGKTAIVHEVVHRWVASRTATRGSKRRFWSLSPQRLIAGMSLVGQWEERAQAIFEHVAKKKHVLYVDDLLALFRVGRSSASSLSVGDVLKPWLERGKIALVGELTAPQLGTLEEIDRGFADMLHVVHVEPTGEDETLMILVRLLRELEGRHGCTFSPLALPTVIALQRRHGGDAVFPGKAAAALTRIARRWPGRVIDVDQVLEEHSQVKGLAMPFVSDRVKLTRSDIEAALEERLFGQPEAVAAMADVLIMVKAHLQDPSRPLGSLLFLGPTGVGKTEAAKALAAVLCGDESRLLRFDMNELADDGAAARLIGTFDRPEGRLTSAVRQQPFAVVLLDEIEKAHPSVFDLLLQLLDDGRLTDAGGRTTDFTGVIVVMTSNLGAEEAGKTIGFDDTSEAMDEVYRSAARRFFRPELFNRIDRIVPFRRLDRAVVRRIAERTLRGLLEREGLRRRSVLLDLREGTLDQIVELGFHPTLGARALQRAVERKLARPLSVRLAPITPGTPTILSVAPAGAGDFSVGVVGLEEAERRPFDPSGVDLGDSAAMLARMSALVGDLTERVQEMLPEEGRALGSLGTREALLYEVREGLDEVRQRVDALSEQETALAPDALARVRAKPAKMRRLTRWSWGRDPREVAASKDLREALRDLTRAATPAGAEDRLALLRLLRRLSELRALVYDGRDAFDRRWALFTAELGRWRLEATPARALLSSQWRSRDGGEVRLGLVAELEVEREADSSAEPRPWTVLRGPSLRRALEHEIGAQVRWDRLGSFSIRFVDVVELRDGEDVAQRYARWRGELDEALAGEDAGRALPPIVRYVDHDRTLDVRTGLALEAGEREELLLVQWPVAPELIGGRS